MQMISSAAGTRLAKAKAAMDAAEASSEAAVDGRLGIALFDFDQAARDLADELIAQGFHNMEGE